MTSEYEASQIVIFCHPDNKFSFYSDDNDVLTKHGKKEFGKIKYFVINQK